MSISHSGGFSADFVVAHSPTASTICRYHDDQGNISPRNNTDDTVERS
jgi:hypothetical protein